MKCANETAQNNMSYCVKYVYGRVVCFFYVTETEDKTTSNKMLTRTRFFRFKIKHKYYWLT